MTKITELLKDSLRKVKCSKCGEMKILAEISRITVKDKSLYEDDLTDDDIDYTCNKCIP